MSSMFFVALLALVSITSTNALSCWVSGDDGVIRMESNPSWTHCVLVPRGGEKDSNVYGLGPKEDSTYYYENAFSSEDPSYQIKSVCILEQYDFAATGLPMLANQPVQYMFRCMCDKNLCNSYKTFSQYLDNASAKL